jgi:hypothetical protein
MNVTCSEHSQAVLQDNGWPCLCNIAFDGYFCEHCAQGRSGATCDDESCASIASALVAVVRVGFVLLGLATIWKTNAIICSEHPVAGKQIKQTILTLNLVADIFLALQPSVITGISSRDTATKACVEAIELILGQKLLLAGVCFVICSWLEFVKSTDAGNQFSVDRLQRNVNVATLVFMLSLVPFVLSMGCAPTADPNVEYILFYIGMGGYALYVLLLVLLAAYCKKEFMRITARKLTLVNTTDEFKSQIRSSQKRVQTTVRLFSVASMMVFVAFAIKFSTPDQYW